MDLWIEFYFALSEKWAVGVMGWKIAIRMEARRVKN
jgi:hypothetical protein